MKTVKIILTLAVIGLIAYFVINSVGKEGPIGIADVSIGKNDSSESINKEINNLSILPKNTFCENKYNEIKFRIDDDYDNNRFGDTQLENDQMKVSLSKNLYSVYTEKFIQQSFYVFNGPTWDIFKIRFIRSELNKLRSSTFLIAKSPVDIKLLEIQQILHKYDEVNDFIASSSYFILPNNDLDSKFPFSNLKSIIDRIDTYKINNMGHSSVNNCVRLHSELSSNKKNLINSYLRYLEYKIDIWMGKYQEFQFATFNEYRNIIYNPLKNELDQFRTNCNDNDYVYNINRYNALLRELNADSNAAYSSFQ